MAKKSLRTRGNPKQKGNNQRDLPPGERLPPWPWSLERGMEAVEDLLRKGKTAFLDDIGSFLFLHCMLLARIVRDATLAEEGRRAMANRVLRSIDDEIPVAVTTVDWSGRFPGNLMVHVLYHLYLLRVDSRPILSRIHEPKYFTRPQQFPWTEPGGKWEAFAGAIAPKEIRGPMEMWLAMKFDRLEQVQVMAAEYRGFDRGELEKVMRECAVYLAGHGDIPGARNILHSMRYRHRVVAAREVIKRVVEDRGADGLLLLGPILKDWEDPAVGFWVVATLVARGNVEDGKRALEMLKLSEKDQVLSRIEMAYAQWRKGEAPDVALLADLVGLLVPDENPGRVYWDDDLWVCLFKAQKVFEAVGDVESAKHLAKMLTAAEQAGDGPSARILLGLCRGGLEDTARRLAYSGTESSMPVGVAANLAKVYFASAPKEAEPPALVAEALTRITRAVERRESVDEAHTSVLLQALFNAGEIRLASRFAGHIKGFADEEDPERKLAEALSRHGDLDGAMECLARDLIHRRTWIDDAWQYEDRMEEMAIRSVATRWAREKKYGAALDLLARVEKRGHGPLAMEAFFSGLFHGGVKPGNGMREKDQATAILEHWYCQTAGSKNTGEKRAVEARLRTLPMTLPTLVLHLKLARWHVGRKEAAPAVSLLKRSRDILAKVTFVKSTLMFMPARERYLMEIQAMENALVVTGMGPPKMPRKITLVSPVADPKVFERNDQERGIDIKERAIQMGKYVAFCHQHGFSEAYEKGIEDGIRYVVQRTATSWEECQSQWLRSFFDEVAGTGDLVACRKIIKAMKDPEDVAEAYGRLAEDHGAGMNPWVEPALAAWEKAERRPQVAWETCLRGRFQIWKVSPRGAPAMGGDLRRAIAGRLEDLRLNGAKNPEKAWATLTGALKVLIEYGEVGLTGRALRILLGILKPWIPKKRKKSGEVPSTQYYGDSVLVNADFDNGDKECMEAIALCLKAGRTRHIPACFGWMGLLPEKLRTVGKVYRHFGPGGLAEAEALFAPEPRWIRQAGLEGLLEEPEKLFAASSSVLKAFEGRLSTLPRLRMKWQKMKEAEWKYRKG